MHPMMLARAARSLVPRGSRAWLLSSLSPCPRTTQRHRPFSAVAQSFGVLDAQNSSAGAESSPSAQASSTSTQTPKASAQVWNGPIQASKPPVSFYRRPLPTHLIPFSSSEGKAMFREALDMRGMEGYFTLAEQYITQSEPAYCGLGTMAMVLNALAVDPNKTWKGPWRWYTEELLECCRPLDYVKTQGMLFSEFSSLTRCNGAKVDEFRADIATVDDFRHSISLATSDPEKSHTTHLVVSYDRGTLSQTGQGHFSPIGGYHPGQDMVLVLDVARFKYPPYWVKVDLLWKAMLVHDPITSRSRGFFLISRLPEAGTSCPSRIRGWESHGVSKHKASCDSHGHVTSKATTSVGVGGGAACDAASATPPQGN
eukprot:Opistho-2@829